MGALSYKLSILGIFAISAVMIFGVVPYAMAGDNGFDPCEKFNGPDFLLGLLVPEMYQAFGGSTVFPCADLSLEKSDDPDPVVEGQLLTYTYTIRNDGPNTAPGVVFYDYLPEGTTFVSSSHDCTDYGYALHCNVGQIQEGTSREVTVTVRVDTDWEEDEIISNYAHVYFEGIDPYYDNNSDSERTHIADDPCEGADNKNLFLLGLLVPDMYQAFGGTSTFRNIDCSDLSLTKTVDNTNPQIFDGVITYVFTVTNAGPDAAKRVEVSDSWDTSQLQLDDIEGDAIKDTSPCGSGCVEVELEEIPAGESRSFTMDFIVEETGKVLNFAEITNSKSVDRDSTPGNGNGETAVEDDEATAVIFPCNDEEILDPNQFLLGLLVPDMYQAFGGTTLLPVVPCTHEGTGRSYDDPTLGIILRTGYFALSDGFCFDQFCLDVLEYFNHLPIQEVDSGSTHTITLTAWCPNGNRICNYASVGASPPGTDINSVDWNMIVERVGSTDEFVLTEYDPNNMIGTVTVTVQEVGENIIIYTFNIQFLTPASIGTVDGDATPPEDNMFVVTEIRDSNGGSARNIFNEGIFVDDIYAYPQVDAAYQSPVDVEPLCLNADSTQRNSCAFDLVKQWTLKQAEEKLQEMYDQKGTDMDSYDESEEY